MYYRQFGTHMASAHAEFFSSACKTCFDLAHKSLPRPFRPFKAESLLDDRPWLPNIRMSPRTSIAQVPYEVLKSQRRRFKNIRIFFSQLPDSPWLPNIRTSRPRPKEDTLSRFANSGPDLREHRVGVQRTQKRSKEVRSDGDLR